MNEKSLIASRLSPGKQTLSKPLPPRPDAAFGKDPDLSAERIVLHHPYRDLPGRQDADCLPHISSPLGGQAYWPVSHYSRVSLFRPLNAAAL